jgi:hypothetical protein
VNSSSSYAAASRRAKARWSTIERVVAEENDDQDDDETPITRDPDGLGSLDGRHRELLHRNDRVDGITAMLKKEDENMETATKPRWGAVRRAPVLRRPKLLQEGELTLL